MKVAIQSQKLVLKDPYGWCDGNIHPKCKLAASIYKSLDATARSRRQQQSSFRLVRRDQSDRPGIVVTDSRAAGSLCGCQLSVTALQQMTCGPHDLTDCRSVVKIALNNALFGQTAHINADVSAYRYLRNMDVCWLISYSAFSLQEMHVLFIKFNVVWRRFNASGVDVYGMVKSSDLTQFLSLLLL